MRKCLLAATGVAVALVALPAAAQDAGWYGQFGVGASLGGSVDVDGRYDDGTDVYSESADLDLENGWLVTGAVGMDHGPFRVEGELVYSDNDVEDIVLTDGSTTVEIEGVSVSHLAALVNLYYDFDTGAAWTPYVGAGVGYGGTRVSFDGEDEGDSGLAWQVRAGLTVQSSPSLSWDIGYRYLDMAEFEYSESDGVEEIMLRAAPKTHSISVSARFAF